MIRGGLGQVAQWIELLTTDQKVGGSNPSLLTIQIYSKENRSNSIGSLCLYSAYLSPSATELVLMNINYQNNVSINNIC